MIIAHYDFEKLEHKIKMLPWQRMGLSYNSTGYGCKIPTKHMVRLPGEKRWRRIYCCYYSNSGTCYVTQGKDWICIH